MTAPTVQPQLIARWEQVHRAPVRRPDPVLVHMYHRAQSQAHQAARFALHLVNDQGLPAESERVKAVIATVKAGLSEELRLRGEAAVQVVFEDWGHRMARLTCWRQLQDLRRTPLDLCLELKKKLEKEEARQRLRA